MNPFEGATKAAIDEIIRNHAKATKFGFILSPESFSELTNEFYEFICTSRSLKEAGDRLLGGGFAPAKREQNRDF